jgi:hypothetical protein
LLPDPLTRFLAKVATDDQKVAKQTRHSIIPLHHTSTHHLGCARPPGKPFCAENSCLQLPRWLVHASATCLQLPRHLGTAGCVVMHVQWAVGAAPVPCSCCMMGLAEAANKPPTPSRHNRSAACGSMVRLQQRAWWCDLALCSATTHSSTHQAAGGATSHTTRLAVQQQKASSSRRPSRQHQRSQRRRTCRRL